MVWTDEDLPLVAMISFLAEGIPENKTSVSTIHLQHKIWSVFLTARSTSTLHGTSRRKETLSGGERLIRDDDSRMITLPLLDGETLQERILLRVDIWLEVKLLPEVSFERV
mmetsp:Transcript_16062/g.37232  ORF Transcript_16062/g.37232 Transcript_16062/m.37232 type:complete len:111 (+) Transcript_16062:4896-5228(+)